MRIKQTITNDMKQAMKDRDMAKLTTLRTLLSEIKNFEIDNGEQDDAGVQKVVAKVAKQVNESITEYGKGGREDLVAEEKAKLEVLEAYLPQQMSDEELRNIVQEVVDQSSDKNMGPIIGQVMKKVTGQAEGNRVSQMVREALSA